MRAIIQRCKSASVTIDGAVHSSISQGLMVLVGIGVNDTQHESDWLATKILNLKLFDDGGQDWGWKRSVMEAGGQVLCVSQFTLLANTKKGFKPDFHNAMGGDTAFKFYNDFLADLKAKYPGENLILNGQFGANMQVELINQGPTTIILDSDEGCPARPVPKAKPTAEEKAAYKEKLAAKQAAQKARRERIAAEQSGAESASGAATSAKSDEGEALTERFKVAMAENY